MYLLPLSEAVISKMLHIIWLAVHENELGHPLSDDGLLKSQPSQETTALETLALRWKLKVNQVWQFVTLYVTLS